MKDGECDHVVARPGQVRSDTPCKVVHSLTQLLDCVAASMQHSTSVALRLNLGRQRCAPRDKHALARPCPTANASNKQRSFLRS